MSYLDVGIWRTRVLEVGEGEPLILMHGSGGHLEAYLRNLRALSKKYRVIAYDFPGHGYTTLATEDLELPTYVQHLRMLMDVLDIDRASLDGESLVGWVAVKFAAQYPQRVDRVVLNTPGGTMARPEVMERIRSLSQEAADDPTPETVRRRLEWLMAHASSVTDELVDPAESIHCFSAHREGEYVVVDKAELAAFRGTHPSRAGESVYDRLYADPHQDTPIEPYVTEIHRLARQGLSGGHGDMAPWVCRVSIFRPGTICSC